jgi:glycosyltransferase involved in cell wall biosynthesis
MVARFAPQKNQSLLLDACAPLQIPFRLQFAGSGPTQPEIERKAERLGLRDRVEFLGDRSDISSVLAGASVFALATNWEGLPLSILEALRAGLPVVASDVGGVRETVLSGHNGFLVPRNDTAAFSYALESLLSDHQLRRRMAANSRRMFEEHFTVEQMLRKTFDFYRQSVSLPVGEFETSQVG